MRQLAGAGDQVRVVNTAGRTVASTAVRPSVLQGQLRRAMATGRVAAYPVDDYYVVIAPVESDRGDGSVGAVVLARPTAGLNGRIAALWGIIAVISGAGLVAAALVAIGLAKWVSRPLSELARAASAA